MKEKEDMKSTDAEIESELGKKVYWDKFYQLEVNNFKENQDEGEVWFGLNVQKKLIQFIEEKFPKDIHILDVGSGNCMFLLALYEKGFTKLTGCDYSEKGVELGNLVVEECASNIEVILADLLHCTQCLNQRFDLVTDKGTFDVIYLNSQIDNKKYAEGVHRFLKKEESSRLLITSCNCTKIELNQVFEGCGLFKEEEEVKGYKSIEFGGKKGQVVTSVLYKALF